MDNLGELNIKASSDVFWISFAGQFVEILCKYETAEKMPLVIQAHLVDIDDEYYFLGENPIEVDSAVKKADVVFMATIKTKNPMMEVLEDMAAPETEEEVN